MQIKYQLFLRSKCAKLRNSFAVKCVSICRHISFVTSDRFWVSDRGRNLTLTNTKGDILCGLTDVCSGDGFHAVNNENELFFIDAENDIKKTFKRFENINKIYTKNRCSMDIFVFVLVLVNRRATSWNARRAQGYIEGNPVQSDWPADTNNTIQ